MIDWLKYYPIEIRQCKHTEDPGRGPDFSRAKTTKVVLPEGEIEFCAPKHHSVGKIKSIQLSNQEIINYPFRPYDSPTVANDFWQRLVVARRSWSWLLPWFSGRNGELTFNIEVIRRSPQKQFNGISFFHPRSFELAISNYLDNIYGCHTKPNGEAFNFGPDNWSPRQHLPVSSVSFNILAETTKTLFTFPLSDNKIMVFSFFKRPFHDPLIEEMNDLIERIILSVNVALNITTKNQEHLALINKQNISLSNRLGPFSWPISKLEIEQSEENLASL